MINLKNDIPEAHQYLVGGFSGSLTGISHSRIPMDQIIEVTVNRFSKETGGLSGITQNTGASERWMRINPYMCAWKECMDRKIGKRKSTKHVELGARPMLQDETNVQMVESGLNTWVPNMWNSEQPIVNIATGEEATKELVGNVQSTKERGVKARDSFIARFTTESKKETYFDKITKEHVLTFDKINEKKEKKTPSVEEDEGKSFGDIIINFNEYKLDLYYLLKWPITSKPWAIWPTSKSKSSTKHLLRNTLQALSPVKPSSTLPNDMKYTIVDGMRIVRLISVDVIPRTFVVWAKTFCDHLVNFPGDILHVIFDVYTDEYDYTQPPKGRPVTGKRRHISDLSQPLPKSTEWGEFLSNSGNKRQLVHLLADYILVNIDKNVYVTKDNQCFHKEPGAFVVSVHELRSTHKEADHRIALHAVFASRYCGTVCVVSDDTDVYILLLFVSTRCQGQIYMRHGISGSTDGILYHDLNAMANVLGANICNILPAFHALTGCDYTFNFFYRTKSRAFNVMMSKPQSYKLLLSLYSVDVDFEDIIDFVIHVVYNRPKKEKTLTDSRYGMLYVGKGKNKKYNSTKKIPPDEISMLQKIKRSNLVSYAYHNCLENDFEPLPPKNYGWMNENDELKPIPYIGPCLPSIEQYVEAVSSSTGQNESSKTGDIDECMDEDESDDTSGTDTDVTSDYDGVIDSDEDI